MPSSPRTPRPRRRSATRCCATRRPPASSGRTGSSAGPSATRRPAIPSLGDDPMQEPAPGTVPSGAPAPETGAAPPPSSPERLDRGVPDSAPAAEGAAPAPAGSPPTGAYPAPDPRRWQEQAAQYLAEAQALQARVQALYGEDEQARGIVARLQHLPGEYYLPEVDRYNRESGTRQAEAQAALGRLEQLKLAYERLAFDAE